MKIPSRSEEVSHKTLYKGFFRMDERIFRHERFDGEMSGEVRREIFERGDAVAVLPYDPKVDRVLLIRQFLPGAHYADMPSWPLQIIAGMVDKANESPEDVARREAVEEAGTTVTDLIEIVRYLPSPGGSTETIRVYCALVDLPDDGGVFGLAEEAEDIRTEIYSSDDAIAMLDRGEITPSPAVVALMWLARHRDGLRAQPATITNPMPHGTTDEFASAFRQSRGTLDEDLEQ